MRKMILVVFLFLLLVTQTVAGRLSGKVAVYNGRPTIFVNDQPVYPMLYALTEGGRFTWEDAPSRHTWQFREAGINLVQIDTWFRDIWRVDNTLDMDFVKKQIDATLAVCPDAAIMIRLHVDAPGWWIDENPKELVEYCTGTYDSNDDAQRAKRQSLASFKWRKDATERVKEFCDTLSSSPEGDRVIGIHLAGGVYGEWHYWGFFNEPDTGAVMTSCFRDKLREKYKTDQALQAAWNDAKVTFETASVPNLEERAKTEHGAFRDPQKEQKVIDYYECQQKIVADDVLYFCKTVKEFWPRPIITGAFYGYFFYMNEMAAGGHLEMKQVLNSPYIDFLSAPFGYLDFQRVVGGSGEFRHLAESIKLHNKLAMLEFDQGTHLGDVFGRKPPVNPGTIEDSMAAFRRNVGQVFTRGIGMWWYDFGPKGDSGWWDDSVYMSDIARLKKLADKLETKQYKPAADVLFVYDTYVFYYLGLPNQKTDTISLGINEMSDDVHHAGIAFDTIDLMDLDKVNLSQYKVVVFANTWLLDEAKRNFIKNKVEKDGRTVVFLYAPGYTDGKTLDISRISALTGIKIKEIELSGAPKIVVDDKSKWLPKCGLYSSISTQFGLKEHLYPLFSIEDKGAQAVGYYKGTDYVALARKKLPHCTVWYSGLLLRDPDLMREIFRSGGAHIYDECNDVIFAGGGLLVVHTKNGGKRKLMLPNRKSFETKLQSPSTTYFDINTGEIVLGYVR
ncbi:MAG: hypothetical protein ABFD64_13215 [Armatimonadota bacterium]